MKPSSRPRRGQTMVLGALSMLILALMMALSFNLAQAIHEKVRVQQHADATALSMATLEARTLNYLAYSNRAQAATYVTLTTLHAYMSMLSAMITTNEAAAKNWEMVIAAELSCCSCYGCYIHCEHAEQAEQPKENHDQSAQNYESTLNGLDSLFTAAVTGLDLALEANYQSEAQMVAFAKQVASGQHLDQLKSYNAPQATVDALASLNVQELGCAIEGVSGLSCTGGGSGSDETARSKVMTDIANAARPSWTTSHATQSDYASMFNLQFMTDSMPGQNAISWSKGTARVVEDTGGITGAGQQGEEGKMIAAEEKGRVTVSSWICACGLGSTNTFESHVESDENGGGHDPGHSGSDHKFEGISANSSCMGGGNCFVGYRHNSDADDDFGQPSVYAYVKQDLSRNVRGNRGPWEINANGKVELDHGGQGTGSLTLRAPEGTAASKAMVYYHRLGDWHEHPNLFNPFWRAKLHPWSSASEAEDVLEKAGDPASDLMDEVH